MSARHFVSTRPACRACRQCGRLELVGLAEGLPYRVEPAPLTALAELLARVDGRRTYGLVAGEIAHRDATRIRGDTLRGRPPVFAEHDCQRPAAVPDVDPQHLPSVRPLIRIMSDPLWGKVTTETEHALFTLGRELNGRVIAVDEKPPF